MEKFRFIIKNKIKNLPQIPGVYAFKSKKELLYIGKAKNIKERVESHFHRPVFRDNLFLKETKAIGYILTDSEIEALILEANLIKKYQPKFNVMWRDDKNYFYVAIDNKIPYVFITHQPVKQIKTIGPFTDGKALKQTLRILRKIFPFYSAKKHPKTLCFYCHLGLCPGPDPDLVDCKKNIKNLISFFEGKKSSVLKNLKKEMATASKNQEFEKASVLRDKIYYLENVLQHRKILTPQSDPWTGPRVYQKTETKLKKLLGIKEKIARIEGYDISNIQGEQATGSMVVFTNGAPDKNEYKKFKIKMKNEPNDIAMLEEVISRRLAHKEWKYPDVMLIDGGRAQLNVVINLKLKNLNSKTILNDKFQNTKILAIAKRNNELYIEGISKPVLLKNLPQEIYNLILYIRDESHRFAKSYHGKLREKELQK